MRVGDGGPLAPAVALAVQDFGPSKDVKLVPVEDDPHNVCVDAPDEVNAALLDPLAAQPASEAAALATTR